MAIDTRAKRQSTMGVSLYVAMSPVPNSAKDKPWRQQSGFGYSGIEVNRPEGSSLRPIWLRNSNNFIGAL